jgi:hypothetical protein
MNLFVLLGISRFINPSYKIFVNEFIKVKTNSTKEARQVIKYKQKKKSLQFDFRNFYQNLIFLFHIGSRII